VGLASLGASLVTDSSGGSMYLIPVKKKADLQCGGATTLFTVDLLQVECFLLSFPLFPSCTYDSLGFRRQIF